MPGYIRLVYQTIDITFEPGTIVSGAPPRIFYEMPENARSMLGYIINKGRIYEEHHLFEFGIIWDERKRQQINALYQLWHRERRNRRDTKILLIDTTTRLEEPMPRSRAIAPPPDDSIEIFDDIFCSYFAQFWVNWAKRPDFNIPNRVCNLAFEETEVKVTP